MDDADSKKQAQADLCLTANPPDGDQFRRMAEAADSFVRGQSVVAPVTLAELRELTAAALRQYPEFQPWQDWLLVMIHNALWRDTVSAVPYRRRILLLPQCLRDSQRCAAPIDEYGLLCQGCGGCDIDALQRQAEGLGMLCLVAEGSAVVQRLLAEGTVEAVIGVSCLDALERSFPYLVRNAVPGLAFPLYADGCKDTETCTALVRAAFAAYRDGGEPLVDLTAVSRQVNRWFSAASLSALLGPEQGPADSAARQWLAAGGRRFRPFLVVAAARCLGGGDIDTDIDLQRLALAVECFHKASLIHDDIQDQEAFRYGRDTVYRQLGVPMALNIGDLLLGQGYRLLADCEMPAARQQTLLRLVSQAHVRLCRGQGAELWWRRQPQACAVAEILSIMRDKTAPAFEVALLLGLVHAGADAALVELLRGYSEHLGVAYQIGDDLRDYRPDAAPCLSLVTALAQEQGLAPAAAWQQARHFYEQYRQQTLRSIATVRNSAIKRLFFQITMRLLPDVPDPSIPFL